MTLSDTEKSGDALVNPQCLHCDAPVHLGPSVNRDKEKAQLHDAGDARKAKSNGNIANQFVARLLEVSGRALNIQI